jgi:predicted DNA-binding transcriptional regulator AlpA
MHSSTSSKEGHALRQPIKPTRGKRRPQQPLEVLNVPGARLEGETIEALGGPGPAARRKYIAEDTFPEPDRYGACTCRWSSEIVREWLNGRRDWAAYNEEKRKLPGYAVNARKAKRGD